MYKKLYIIILLISFVFIFFEYNKKISLAKISYDIKTVQNPDSQIVSKFSNTTATITLIPKKDGSNKLDIGFDDYYHNYNGYIDQVAMFDNIYDNQDYDGDGINDRIYRRVFEIYKDGKYAGMNTNYRIDFGNGTKLDIGDFNDIFTGIQIIGYDLTGDGINEIIFLGKHIASTFPPSGSEIAVYKKKDNGYIMMALPRQTTWSGLDKYEFGLNFNKLSMDDNNVVIYSPDTDKKLTLNINNNAIDYFSRISGQIAHPAWKINVTQFNNIPTLILYNHVGFKYYDKDIATYLIWSDGYFKPIKMEIVPSVD